MGPDSEFDSRRRMPPGTMSRTEGTSISSAAMLSALVMTLMDLSSSVRMRRAISAVVVPESRMMVSPSRMSARGCRAMRCLLGVVLQLLDVEWLVGFGRG